MSFYQFLHSFLLLPHLPFANLLSEPDIDAIVEDVGIDVAQEEADAARIQVGDGRAGRRYTSAITLWGFLSQFLFKGEHRSCAAAVLRVITLCVALNRTPPSPDTGAFCRARQRLPIALVRRMTTHLARAAEREVPRKWLWNGRHVFLVDGTTVSGPDTVELQKEFPQLNSQKPGLGFPIIRLVVLMSLATAMLMDMAHGPIKGKETGETALFRELVGGLQPNDVIVADRYFCSYFMVALLRELRVDVVFRIHQCREVNLTQGQRLGPGDRIATWHRPARPKWMSEADYDRMPETLQVREFEVRVAQPGFRVESFVVATTLLDAEAYPKDEVSELYRQRWMVELDIEVLKVRLGLDVLRTKSVEMAEKELWTGFLTYNLIRQSLLQAAHLKGRTPRQLSFATAMQATAATMATLATASEEAAKALIEVHLKAMGKAKIGDRPGRVEPRAVKRRANPIALLTKPRGEAKADLLKARGEKTSLAPPGTGSNPGACDSGSNSPEPNCQTGSRANNSTGANRR